MTMLDEQLKECMRRRLADAVRVLAAGSTNQVRVSELLAMVLFVAQSEADGPYDGATMEFRARDLALAEAAADLIESVLPFLRGSRGAVDGRSARGRRRRGRARG